MTLPMANADPGKASEWSGLREADVDADPLAQFRAWYEQALAAGQPLPEAMTLATATPTGQPSARMVLLRGHDEHGFVFYTNYESRKAQELTANPQAALVFYWPTLDRQIRIEGRVERVSAEQSDAYFRSRPRDSQLGAWASPQSQIIPGRETLERHLAEILARFGQGEVPRPPHWGGFRVVPEVIEFWQARAGRLHDRLRYRRLGPARWLLERLAP
jgi:pyridoxamine 5'-phosphate oxidase